MLPLLSSARWSRAPALAGGGGLLGYAFGTTDQNVTVFDVASRRVLASSPLGATVRWLSNEQTFWDGRLIWTYDFPGNEVEAVAIDPLALAVRRRIATGGTGPAHSLMLTPDRQTAWMNIAGSNELAVIDLVRGDVVDRVGTGEFP